MYPTGHYGVALLVYAPLGHLVGTIGAEFTAVLGAVLAVSVSTIPDWDRRVPGIDHRGVTHSVAFATVVASTVAGVALIVLDVSAGPLVVGYVAFAFLVAFLSVLSHVAADALTPTGVRPFWPLSRRRVALGIVRSANPGANWLAFGSGVVALSVALLTSM